MKKHYTVLMLHCGKPVVLRDYEPLIFWWGDNGNTVTVTPGSYHHIIMNFSLHSWQLTVRLVKEHGFSRLNELNGLEMPA
jgi:hypothetical protein